MYRIFFKKSAEKELARLPQSLIYKIYTLTQKMQINPLLPNSQKLSGYKDLYRIRIGDYRINYLLEKAKKKIIVTKIGHRREVYR